MKSFPFASLCVYLLSIVVKYIKIITNYINFALVKYNEMGKIQLEAMEFYAFHGHYTEEQIVGNKFLVDLTIETDMTMPADTDDLADAVNYQSAYKLVKQEMGKKSRLLENIAKRILDTIYVEFKGINRITITIRKMNPPIGGKVKSVAVTLTR